MSLSPITSSSILNASASQTSFQQRRSEFQQLSQALQSGDLGAAQTAFSALSQGSSNFPAKGAADSPLSQDFTAIGKALQSGDLGGAQQAFAKFKQDLKAQGTQSQGTQGAHHGRHHHHRADADGDNDSSTTASADTSSTGTQTTGSIVNLTA